MGAPPLRPPENAQGASDEQANNPENAALRGKIMHETLHQLSGTSPRPKKGFCINIEIIVLADYLNAV